MVFSQEQRVFIVEHYFATRSYARDADEFRLRYPDAAVPNNAKIRRLINRFRESGSVADKKRSARRAILTEAKLAEVERTKLQSLSKSLRDGQLKQAFRTNWIRYSSLTKPGLSGYANSQNSRIWSSANPHVLHEKPLHCQKIGVWCAVSRRRIVGPLFFFETVNSGVYQDIVGSSKTAPHATLRMQPCCYCANSSVTVSLRQGYGPRVHQICRLQIFSLGVPVNQCLQKPSAYNRGLKRET
ncbi:hypothetical protein PR048_020295 [Dryococelus australis]|uniref:DUF4817 domain-containing protein n=1 Tax=Dryococelus australis TaxID=614101 RepID=A0ABQ9H603_9NEOP|nr:hypothetical protein PR048_020295 [Dryococelus australis]